MSGGWGVELWDQFDNIAVHTQKGIDFCEKFAQFIKERCIIENEYAAKLKKLSKSYQPKRKEEDHEFSYMKGFVGMISEIYDIAGQHEFIAENLTSGVLQSIQLYVQQVKQDRKKHLQDGAKQFSNLQSQLQTLDKAKRHYDKMFRESEKAQELYRKADADIHMSRADVEKAKNVMVQRQQISEDSKSEYAAELQKTNDFQREHYNVLMPQVFQELQVMEESRVKKVQELLRACSDVERNILPIVNTCIEGMVKSSDLVSDAEDSKVVIEKYKSGFVPPGDIPFEDLSSGGGGGSIGLSENHSPSVNLRQSVRIDSIKGGTKVKRRTGIFGIFSGSKTDDTKEDYSHLPPNQQKKKLIQRIDSIKTTLGKETAERDGMLKMQEVYKQNQALGDPQSLSKQLEENAQKLDKLRLELQKFDGYLVDMDRPQRTQCDIRSTNRSSISLTTSLHESQPTTPIANRGSYQDVTRINHDLDKSATFGGTGGGGGGGGGGGEGLGVARLDSFDDIDEDSAVIGTCVALYAFDAPSEGSISMGEGEEFNIVEHDQGDGWLRVRRSNGEEGFVPTSYVECHFHNS